jgi:hypothetical protein
MEPDVEQVVWIRTINEVIVDNQKIILWSTPQDSGCTNKTDYYSNDTEIDSQSVFGALNSELLSTDKVPLLKSYIKKLFCDDKWYFGLVVSFEEPFYQVNVPTV